MRKILDIYQPQMLRPIIYSTFTKFVCSLCLVLLWDRFVNAKNTVPYGVVDFAFFIAGAWLLLWAWMQYLALDGMTRGFEVFEKIGEMFKRKPKHFSRDFVDFVDEKVITYDMLEEDEQQVTRLLSNLFSGILFLIPAFIASIL